MDAVQSSSPFSIWMMWSWIPVWVVSLSEKIVEFKSWTLRLKKRSRECPETKLCLFQDPSSRYTYPSSWILQFRPTNMAKKGVMWSGDRLNSRGWSRFWSHCHTTESLTEGSDRFALSKIICSMAGITAGLRLFWFNWRTEKIREDIYILWLQLQLHLSI